MSTPTGRGAAPEGWTIVIPVKALGRAKSRLARALPQPTRRELVLAMATDVVCACTAATDVVRVRVVSSDDDVAVLARELSVDVVPEPASAELPRTADPLNAALTAALDGVTGPVGVVTADLPELRATHLDVVLAAAAHHTHSIVPDHRGAGTTMAFWNGAADRRVPRFGARSAERFVSQGGAVPLVEVDASGAVGRDVDTPEDLDALAGRPVGTATAHALRRHLKRPDDRLSGFSATMVP